MRPSRSPCLRGDTTNATHRRTVSIWVREFVLDRDDGLALGEESVNGLRIKMRTTFVFHDLEAHLHRDRWFVGASAAEGVEDIGHGGDPSF